MPDGSLARVDHHAASGLEGILRALQPGRPTIRRAIPTTRRVRPSLPRSKAFALAEVPDPHTAGGNMDDGVAIPTMDVWVADLDGVVVGQMMLDAGWVHHLHRPSWNGPCLGDES